MPMLNSTKNATRAIFILQGVMVVLLFGCTVKSSDDRPRAQDATNTVSLPVMGEFELAAMQQDSTREYGAGDCYGDITHFSDIERSLVIDSMTCSEYSFRFSHYLLQPSNSLSAAYVAQWNSTPNNTMDGYDHVFTETVYLFDTLNPKKMVRSDTMEMHYLQSKGYPSPLSKPFIIVKEGNLSHEQTALNESIQQSWSRENVE